MPIQLVRANIMVVWDQSGANLMRYFECIENHPNLRLTIFNAAHDAQ